MVVGERRSRPAQAILPALGSRRHGGHGAATAASTSRSASPSGCGRKPASPAAPCRQLRGGRIGQQDLRPLDGKTAMLIGAGTMGELAARHLLAHGVGTMIVTQPHVSTARWNWRASFMAPRLPFNDLGRYLPLADVVIGSVGADHFVLTHRCSTTRCASAVPADVPHRHEVRARSTRPSTRSRTSTSTTSTTRGVRRAQSRRRAREAGQGRGDRRRRSPMRSGGGCPASTTCDHRPRCARRPRRFASPSSRRRSTTLAEPVRARPRQPRRHDHRHLVQQLLHGPDHAPL